MNAKATLKCASLKYSSPRRKPGPSGMLHRPLLDSGFRRKDDPTSPPRRTPGPRGMLHKPHLESGVRRNDEGVNCNPNGRKS